MDWFSILRISSEESGVVPDGTEGAALLLDAESGEGAAGLAFGAGEGTDAAGGGGADACPGSASADPLSPPPSLYQLHPPKMHCSLSMACL